jgi:hypothetical protein
MPYDINGAARTVDGDGDTPFLWVLRDVLGMTGTKFRLRRGAVRPSNVRCSAGIGWAVAGQAHASSAFPNDPLCMLISSVCRGR